MSLRRQLLVVALLLLSLPWAGCQFVREMEGALRAGQAQALRATGEAVAAVLAQRPTLIYPFAERYAASHDKRRSVYAQPTASPVIVDGYDDGWENVLVQNFTSSQGAGSVQTMAQTRDGMLYLLIRVRDNEIIYHNPALSDEANGDRLVLRLWHRGKRQDYVIATAAPGNVRARAVRRQQALDAGRIRGVWQDDFDGYTIELALPLSYTGGRLGFYVVNERTRDGRSTGFLGNISRGDGAAPPWLIYSPDTLQALLASLASSGTEIVVADREGWQVGHARGGARVDGASADTFWLLQLLYRSILADAELGPPPHPDKDGKLQALEATAALQGQSTHQRYSDPAQSGRSLLSSAVPVNTDSGLLGAVIVRESSETYLTLTDEAFSRLLRYSMAAMALGIGALLLYASVLSWRIRRLSLAASRAVAEDGRIAANFKQSNMPDEVGELSRQYGELLARVRRYNDYLHSLSRKLSHELRTPIAVIQGSLDNLEASDASRQADYVARAREGLARLQRILTAMGEASVLEDSIRGQPLAPTNLTSLLSELFPVYRDLYTEQRLTLVLPTTNARVNAAPELLVQALDKLMDNAASFTPPQGSIQLRLVQAGRDWHIQVANQGPPLPQEMGDALFEAMVSRREPGSDEVHLGLGLHIVRLVMDHHQGQVIARNSEDGVVFTLVLRAVGE